MPYQIMGRAFAAILLPLLFAACTSAPKAPAPPPAPLVFPPAPDEPRFVFERSLRFNSDIEQVTFWDRLKRFAAGDSAQHKGLLKPYGVAAYQGRVYVTDTEQRAIILFDIPQQRYREFGVAEPGQVLKPIGIDIAPQRQEVYVSDVTAKRIVVYDLDGNFLRALGNSSLFNRPTGLSLSPDGSRLYVVDTGGIDSEQHRIVVLDSLSGQLLHNFGQRGVKEGEFNMPMQAATTPDGKLYVVDKGNFRVQAFDPDGKFLLSFGQAGRFPGQFASPKGIATDPDGNIYVVDVAFGNLQIFNPQGQLLMFLGSRGDSGAPAQYTLPAGVDVDETGRIYIVDQFFRKVDVFRPAQAGPPPAGAPSRNSASQ